MSNVLPLTIFLMSLDILSMRELYLLMRDCFIPIPTRFVWQISVHDTINIMSTCVMCSDCIYVQSCGSFSRIRFVIELETGSHIFHKDGFGSKSCIQYPLTSCHKVGILCMFQIFRFFPNNFSHEYIKSNRIVIVILSGQIRIWGFP